MQILDLEPNHQLDSSSKAQQEFQTVDQFPSLIYTFTLGVISPLSRIKMVLMTAPFRILIYGLPALHVIHGRIILFNIS
jgi:hypothetical protein